MTARSCILNSGGMDSYLTWWLNGNADNVFVDIEHKYKDKELDALAALSSLRVEARNKALFSYRIINGPKLGPYETPSGIIPNRNAELILAASTAGYTDIMMGVLADEINSDKSPEFMSAMQTMLDIAWRQQYWNSQARVHRIFSPIRRFTKSKLVKSYLEQGGDSAALLATVSCYSPGAMHCGACPSCFKRWVALTNNGLYQPWAANPTDWIQLPDIIRKCNDGTYSRARAAEIEGALNA